MRGADLIVFLVDAGVGVTEDDDAVAAWLRRAGKPVLLGTTRPTTTSARTSAGSSCRWAWASRYPISALHGRRTGDFLDEVVARLPGPSDDGADALGG